MRPIGAGIHIHALAGYGVPDDAWWNLPVTILWLVACTNAINLIDGVDGLATGGGTLRNLHHADRRSAAETIQPWLWQRSRWQAACLALSATISIRLPSSWAIAGASSLVSCSVATPWSGARKQRRSSA